VVTDGSALRDSVLFYNDGLHGDGSAGDSIWGARLLAPTAEGTFTVSVETKDITQGTSRRLPDAMLLTTAGPLALDSVKYLDHSAESYCEVLPYVKNIGSTAAFRRPTVGLVCADPWVTGITPAVLSFADIAPGQTRNPIGKFQINYNPSTFPGHFNLKFELGINRHVCWSAPEIVTVTGIAAEEQPLPAVYALEQNYPNPFNPTTVVSSQLPVASHVRLVVYDLLGREVAVLANERRAAGSYRDSFDGTGLASGLYIYRLTAGQYVESRKMILIK
jgi:hypothetical protein